MPRKVFITAAEMSGDQHASQLIHGLRVLDPSVMIEGHGGSEMARAGATIHRETTSGAAMFHQALSRVREMWRLLRWTRRYFQSNRPDLLICVDSPAMNFHFARIAHELGIPVLYYIAPQLWAWREGRMYKLRRWVDQVACILPFEEEYFRQHGVNATFVGHPLFDQLPPQRGPAPGPRFPNRAPVVGLVPGSRRSEARANFPHLLDVARKVRIAFPDVQYLVPTTQATHPIVGRLADGFENLEYAVDQFDQIVPRCDLCVTVSGTATLHVACYGIPMIAVFRFSRVLWNTIGRWLIKTRTYTLVNLLAADRQHIVPEYIPWYGSDRPVSEHVVDFLRHPEKLAQQQSQLGEMVQKLDRPGASRRVAQLAMTMMQQQPRALPMVQSLRAEASANQPG